MTKHDLARIETIVRQQWCEQDEDEFADWMALDQEQALALIEMIPNRLPVHPKPLKLDDIERQGTA